MKLLENRARFVYPDRGFALISQAIINREGDEVINTNFVAEREIKLRVFVRVSGVPIRYEMAALCEQQSWLLSLTNWYELLLFLTFLSSDSNFGLDFAG